MVKYLHFISSRNLHFKVTTEFLSCSLRIVIVLFSRRYQFGTKCSTAKNHHWCNCFFLLKNFARSLTFNVKSYHWMKELSKTCLQMHMNTSLIRWMNAATSWYENHGLSNIKAYKHSDVINLIPCRLSYYTSKSV